MNLVGISVRHSSAAVGEGRIISQNGDYFTVEFSNRTLQMFFPDAFDKFLTAIKPSDGDKIRQAIQEYNQQKQEQREAREKQLLEKQLLELIEDRSNTGKKGASGRKKKA